MATILAEAWCDCDLHIWSWVFRREGTNNDISVIVSSPLMHDIVSGTFKFRDGEVYMITKKLLLSNLYYPLCNGNCLGWVIFANPIHAPSFDGVSVFTIVRKAVCKDVELLFGVLQSRWEILCRGNRRWEVDEVVRMAKNCIILLNALIRMVENGDVEGKNGQKSLLSYWRKKLHLGNGLDKLKNDKDAEGEDSLADFVEIDDILMNEFSVCSQDGFDTLRKELIASLQ